MRTTYLLLGVLALCLPATAGETRPSSAGLAPISDAEWTLDAAAHLLRRAGFGGTLEEIRVLHALGAEGAVDKLLDWEGKPDPRVPHIRLEVTTRPGRAEFMGMSQEQRKLLFRQHRRMDQGQYAVIREWWMQTMIRTAFPARERLTLFWHGHFTSGYRDIRNSYHLYIQNTLFRRHAAGDFRELLHAISKDPAMLEYLDNNRNRKGHPNENYAREVMELYTLGEGHYTEKDIKEAARALTGWTFAGNSFYADARQHDTGTKTILGRTGAFNGDDFLDILLDQPQAYRYIAGRLFRYFAHAAPAPAVLDGLARTLVRSHWQLKPMLKQLLLSREFYSPRSMHARIKGPVELIVGLYRSLGMQSRGALGLSFMAQGLGQSLLDPPNVKGWPGGREWITTSMLLNRYNVCGALVGLPQDKLRTLRNQRMRGMGQLMAAMRRADPNGEEGMMGPEDEYRRRRGRGGFGRSLLARTYDVLAHARRAGAETPAALVDFFTKTLLAVPVGPEMKRTLIEHLTRDGGFQMESRDARSRLHGLLRLIVSTPEFQIS